MAQRDPAQHVQDESDGFRDPIKPSFELATYPLPETQDAIEDVDCQGGTLAVLRRSGRLEISGVMDDRVLLRTLLRNPYKVFVHPHGDYVIGTASDGEIYVQSVHDPRMCATAQLQSTQALSAFIQRSQEVIVGECVGWLPHDQFEAAAPDEGRSSAVMGSREWSCLLGVNKGGAIFALHIRPGSTNPSKLKLRLTPVWSLPSPMASLPVRSIVFELIGADGCVLLISTATQLHEAYNQSSIFPGTFLSLLASGTIRMRTRSVPPFAGAPLETPANGKVLVYRSSPDAAPQSYIWNSATGVVHGLFRRDVDSDVADENERLLFGTTTDADGERACVNEESLPFAKLADGLKTATAGVDRDSVPLSVPPIAVVPTAFHMIFVYARRCLVVHQPPGMSWRSPSDCTDTTQVNAPPSPIEVAQRIRFDPFRSSPPQRSELCGAVRDVDSRRLFLFSHTHLWEIQIEDEAHQNWRLFLERGRDARVSVYMRKRYLDAAYRLAFYSEAQRNLCQYHRGRFFLECGATHHAIVHFAQCNWFEDVYALLTSYRNASVRSAFVEARFEFLLKHCSSPDDRAPQLTGMFILVILSKLDHITRCTTASPALGNAAEAELHKFLLHVVERCGNILKDRAVYEMTVRLLEEQGRRNSALLLAKAMKQTRYVVAYHVAQHEYDEAVKLLGSCHGSAILLQSWYEFTAALIQHRPVALVTALLRVLAREAREGRVLPLHMERLIPSFIRYDVRMNEVAGNCEHQLVVLLDQCIHRYACSSSAVHNYYVGLLAQTHDVVRLEDYINSSSFCDHGYALRLCLKHGCTNAAVALYKRLHLYRDAVTTALYAPPETRTEAAADAAHLDGDALPGLVAAEDALRGLIDRVDEDELHHLWMLTAEYALSRYNVAAGLAVVQESGNILHTEDVLRKVKDVNVVAEFKDAICAYVDSYMEQERRLTAHQEEVYHTAEGVKHDLRQTRQQYGYITASQRCPLCHRTLLQSSAPYFVYPNCGHAVHEACAVSRLEEMGGIEAFLADEGIAPQVLDGVRSVPQLALQDCVLCGEAAIVEAGRRLCGRDASWTL